MEFPHEATEVVGYVVTGLLGAGAMWLKAKNSYSALSGNTEAIDSMRVVLSDLQEAYSTQKSRVDELEIKIIQERADCHKEISALRKIIDELNRDAMMQAEMNKAGREGRIDRRKE